MHDPKPPSKTRLTTALAGLAALVLLAVPVGAHGSDAHGALTLHDEEEGADARDLSCGFWVRGTGMGGASGELHVVQGLDGPDAHGHVLARWEGVPDGDGTHAFEVGPLTLHESDDEAVLFVTFDGAAHQSAGYPFSYRACGEPPEGGTDADAGAGAQANATVGVRVDAGGDAALQVDLCATIDLHAEARGDGSVRLHADGLTEEAALLRAEGDGPMQEVADLDAERRTFVDTDTEAGATYTYRIATQASGVLCPGVEVTAVPVFSAPLAGGLAAALGVAGYAVLRRES